MSLAARPWQRAFLGFSFTSGKQPKRRIAPHSVARWYRRTEKTRRLRSDSRPNGTKWSLLAKRAGEHS